jgi:hypothetical protein
MKCKTYGIVEDLKGKKDQNATPRIKQTQTDARKELIPKLAHGPRQLELGWLTLWAEIRPIGTRI